MVGAEEGQVAVVEEGSIHGFIDDLVVGFSFGLFFCLQMIWWNLLAVVLIDIVYHLQKKRYFNKKIIIINGWVGKLK